jgi:hypothetical protein
MGKRYLMRPPKVIESTHVKYGSIWETTIEIEDTETGRVAHKCHAEGRNGSEAAEKAVIEAHKWMDEHNRALESTMDDKKALETVQRGETLDQSTIKRLLQRGLIEARDVTHLQSPEREFLVTFITPKGKKLLEEA